MDVITPLNNLPNLKQGQNGEEVALEIYDIVLDVKAHLPGPKETVVSSAIVVLAVLLFFLSSLIVIIIAAMKKFLLLCFNFLVYLTNNISYNSFLVTETLEDCY